ncbi:MAG: pyruvate kinase [Acidobacteria bacterium]|nr:pyruvate kinase [Acidobacteriota bacterium]
MPIAAEPELLKRRRTKIVATVGPASSGRDVLTSLIDAGVNVFRLNMSHGTHDGHRAAYDAIRTAAESRGTPIAILADLCGPKIRCGKFDGGSIALHKEQSVTVTTRDVLGRPGLIPSQYKELASDVKRGDRVLLDDGNLELRVDRVEDTEIECTVVAGGTLKDRKGINLPGVNVSAPSLTPKDREDAVFAIGLGVDYIALSFVRTAADVVELRTLLDAHSADVAIIAKIEKPEALANIDAILGAADGLMVARGDLGVELPAESVPITQTQLIDLGRAQGKPVIVATQMLESMITNARPTRAEVSDVATAVMQGTDAIMLSAETASGAFPVAAVETMARVARRAEAYLWSQGAFASITDHEATPPPVALPDAVARATAQLSRDLRVRAIFVVSRSGTTARFVAAARPAAPLVALSDNVRATRRMNLYWGVEPMHVDVADLDSANSLARKLALEHDLASEGDFLLRVSGFSHEKESNVPKISVLTV